MSEHSGKIKEFFKGLMRRKWLTKEWWQAKRIFYAAAIIGILGALDAYNCMYLVGKYRPITLEYLVGFLLTAPTIYLFWWRAINQEKQIKNQERQIDIQIKKEVDDRFTTAVNLLGSSEASARTGAICSLYQQAVDYEKYRKQIIQILCSHIRSKTQEPDYQEQHKYRPSNEIQTTIDLLFREAENKGLYLHQFEQKLPRVNLSYAYCVGANFWGAYFQEAYFAGANFQGANFGEANCQNAKFWRTHCEGAYFTMTYCDGADFKESHCQGADFSLARCQGADFWRANCQGVNLGIIHFSGAKFGETRCEGAYSSPLAQFLEERIGKDTEWQLGSLFGGEKYVLPGGIIPGVLEDSDELQKIIKLLKEIKERNIT